MTLSHGHDQATRSHRAHRFFGPHILRPTDSSAHRFFGPQEASTLDALTPDFRESLTSEMIAGVELRVLKEGCENCWVGENRTGELVGQRGSSAALLSYCDEGSARRWVRQTFFSASSRFSASRAVGDRPTSEIVEIGQDFTDDDGGTSAGRHSCRGRAEACLLKKGSLSDHHSERPGESPKRATLEPRGSTSDRRLRRRSLVHPTRWVQGKGLFSRLIELGRRHGRRSPADTSEDWESAGSRR